MSVSRLTIRPADSPAPAVRSLPLASACRWLASGEDPASTPLLPVFISQPALIRLAEHAGSDLESEVGGILVGDLAWDGSIRQQFIQVETALPARFTRQGSVFLTFTQDSLVDFHSILEEHFPGQRILGWYHTHPGLGVFLSSHDTWLHRHFFPEPWQVAMVIDPYADAAGLFTRQADGSLDASHFSGFYELDGAGGMSYVRWTNLQSIEEGDHPHE